MPTNRTVTTSSATNRTTSEATGTNREQAFHSHIWSPDNTPWNPDSSLPWQDEEKVYDIKPTNRSL